MNYLVKCDRLDHFGRGICYIAGKICFVSNLLPSEEAYIKIIKSKKNYNTCKVVSLEKESAYRIKSTCPYLNCGCALKHLDYEKQLEFKEVKVKNILERYAGIRPKINKIISNHNVNGYRNKITLKASDKLGYFENESNKIIPISSCALVSLRVNEIIKVLNDMDLSKVKEVIIKEFDDIMIIIKGNLDIKPLTKLASSIYSNDKLVYGAEYLETKIDNLKFCVSKDSFFQVNNSLVLNLYKVIQRYSKGSKKIIDLYCGTGTISLLLSANALEVIGVEINKEAALCANKNKELNKISNVSFICGDASKEIKKLLDFNADTIVIDPPRSGLTKEGIEDILEIKPNKIIYVSCDPMTLARDLNILKDLYEIMEVTPIDMFPNTYHVETVTLLEKK